MNLSAAIRKKSTPPLKIVISALILGVLFTRMDMPSLSTLLRAAHVSAVLDALALMLGQIVFLSLRWQLLVNADKYRLTFIDALRITVSGLLANTLLITSLGGPVVRVGLTVRQGMNIIKCLCAVVTDRVLTLAAIALFAIISLPLLPAGMPGLDGHGDLLSACVVATLGAGLVAWKLLGDATRRFVISNRKAAAVAIYLRRIMADETRLALLGLVSLLGQMLYFLAIYAVLTSLQNDVDFAKILPVLPAIALIASLPLGAGGWGVREGAFIFGLGLIGVPKEIAFVASLQIGVISMTSMILAGLPALLDADVVSAFRAARLRHAR
ncbi:MAG TPA: lysylphosphatidylglycerol synthase transmembrane domain-containing protein [Patescibacteria group bacterium]|nr:lysylphosphatidylglycerol synthase transmembrane domain-containing protein [Patescibacteria group bacterium]